LRERRRKSSKKPFLKSFNKGKSDFYLFVQTSMPVILTDLYYFCSRNTKKDEYKCQTGKMADSSKAAQAVGQTCSDGAGYVN
jgi:hypothetical protein